MLKDHSFQICFECSFSPKDKLTLQATVNADYQQSCYVVRNIFVLNDSAINKNFIDEIRIRPVVEEEKIIWIHTDSFRTSILSTAIGKAIEANGNLEMLTLKEKVA